jgi:hypothetical protein
MTACSKSETASNISKEDFITKTNEICKSTVADIEAIDTSSSDAEPSFEQASKVFKDLINIQQESVKKIRAVGLPKDDAKELKAILDDLDSATKETKSEFDKLNSAEELDKAFDDDQSPVNVAGDKVDAALKSLNQYGATECGAS